MAHALSLPLAIPVCVAIVSCVAAAHAEDDVLWPQKPVRIDRSKQHYERLPALQESIDRRTWLVVPSRITINDSAAFTFDGTTYRIGNIHPISTKRMCTGRTDAEGPLKSSQELARKKKAGLWNNPACLADFDHC